MLPQLVFKMPPLHPEIVREEQVVPFPSVDILMSYTLYSEWFSKLEGNEPWEITVLPGEPAGIEHRRQHPGFSRR